MQKARPGRLEKHRAANLLPPITFHYQNLKLAVGAQGTNYDGNRPAISGLQEQATIRARAYRSGNSDAYFVSYDLNFTVSVHWQHT